MPRLPEFHIFRIKQLDQLTYCVRVSPLNCKQVKPMIDTLVFSLPHYSLDLTVITPFYAAILLDGRLQSPDADNCTVTERTVFVTKADFEVKFPQFINKMHFVNAWFAVLKRLETSFSKLYLIVMVDISTFFSKYIVKKVFCILVFCILVTQKNTAGNMKLQCSG